MTRSKMRPGDWAVVERHDGVQRIIRFPRPKPAERPRPWRDAAVAAALTAGAVVAGAAVGAFLLVVGAAAACAVAAGFVLAAVCWAVAIIARACADDPALVLVPMIAAFLAWPLFQAWSSAGPVLPL